MRSRNPRPQVSVRYAEISVIFAVCAAYSAGIPILLPVGAVSFLLFYWVEKALFVNFYLTPPQYSGKLTSEVVRYQQPGASHVLDFICFMTCSCAMYAIHEKRSQLCDGWKTNPSPNLARKSKRASLLSYHEARSNSTSSLECAFGLGR